MTAQSRNEPLPDSGTRRRSTGFFQRLAGMIGPSNPLVTREVLTTMRLRSVKTALVALPLLLAVLVLAVAADSQDSVGSAADRGTTLLGIALTAALYVVGLVGAVLGAQSVSSERQSKTLDLVLATGLSPWRIVAGKAMAVWVVLASILLACLPPLGACFLVGGVSLTQLLLAAGIPLAVAALPVAFGVALGTIQRSSRLAVGAAVTFVGLAGPMLFSAAWLAMLAVIGADDVLRNDPFALPTGHEGLWPLVVGGVLTPLYLIVAPTWFLLAASVASLKGRATDRAKPLRRWFAVAGPAGGLLITAIAAVKDIHDEEPVVALIGLLGVVLTLGALALSAHARPRRVLEPSTRLPVGGPNGDAIFTTLITALSLFTPAAALTAMAGVEAAYAALIVLAFVVFISGSGVAFASALRPHLARWALAGITAFTLALPVLLWLALEIVAPGGHRGDAELVNVLSPIGALAFLSTSHYNASELAPLVSVVLWLMIGGTAWSVGASLLKARRRPKATPPSVVPDLGPRGVSRPAGGR